LIHYSTGFSRLDAALNDGGPSPGQVLIWLAATNVGKSIVLCNNSVNSILSGLDTLHVSFEMSAHDTARRILSAMTSTALKRLHDPIEHDLIKRKCRGVYSSHKAKLAIYEMNPEECSVDAIYNLIETLKKTYGWAPKIVVLDYLELMISRHSDYNREDYVRQKHVATEVVGLAKSENVLVYSATQTNRSGTDAATRSANADLNKIAESYGKSMPLDYVISLNQSEDEYNADPPIIRMYVAKNRFGPKFVPITCSANYNIMKITEMS
jgi:replicative DNA helicase